MVTPPPIQSEKPSPVKFVFPFWFKVISAITVVLLAGILLILLSGFLSGVSKEHKKQDEENAVQERDKFNATKAQLALIETALEAYKLDLNSYPTSLEALRNPPADLPNPATWNGPYLNNIPLDSWGRPYNYASPGRYNSNTYDVWSVGPDGVDGTVDDIGNWVMH